MAALLEAELADREAGVLLHGLHHHSSRHAVPRRPSRAPKSRRETATGHLVAREPAAPVPVLLRPRGSPTHVAGSSLPPLSTQSRLSPGPRREPSSRRTRRASLYAMMLAARDSNPNRQIRSLVLSVHGATSSAVCVAQVGGRVHRATRHSIW